MGVTRLSIPGETATMDSMPIPKFFVTSADPAAIKHVAGLLAGLDGLYITVPDLASHITKSPDPRPGSIDALRAYTKHLIEAVESFLPGSHVLVDEFYDAATTPESLTESVRRVHLWGRHTSLVMPVTLSSIEAGNILSRMGNALVFGPVCTVDQVAAILAATEEAAPEQVIVIIDASRLKAAHIAVAPLTRAINELCVAASREIQLMVQVDHHAVLAWAIETGVPLVAATPSVYTEWTAAGSPLVADAAVAAAMEAGHTTSQTIDLKKDKNSFTVSHPVTDDILTATTAAITSLIL